jgi:hypothetical protein
MNSRSIQRRIDSSAPLVLHSSHTGGTDSVPSPCSIVPVSESVCMRQVTRLS